MNNTIIYDALDYIGGGYIRAKRKRGSEECAAGDPVS